MIGTTGIRLLTFAILLLMGTAARSQGTRLIALNTPDSVVLRWAPITAANWRITNEYGYLVERIRVGAGIADPTVDRLSADTIRPWSLERMKQHFPVDHPHAPIAAQALHGRDFAPTPDPADLRTVEDGANELELRYAFAMFTADIDAGVAEALGLRFVDRTAARDASYLYRVIAFAEDRSDTVVLGVNRNLVVEGAPAGPELRATEMEGSIELTWPREMARELFTAYIIERAGPDGSWARLNRGAYLPTDAPGLEPDELYRFTDTTVANYVPYRYRVRGITPFGETGGPGPEFRAMGRDRTAPVSPVMRSVVEEKGQLVVRWEQAQATDLAGFKVEKAPAANGTFIPMHGGLLAASTRSFADTSSFLIGENHYRVLAFDTAGNSAISLTGYGVLSDSIAPMPPTGLRGHIDTTGVVTVEWMPGKEPDLLGFRVFFANAADHEFHNLTPEPLQQALFRDTIPLRTLTKRIYYRVVAVDRNFNHSEASGMLTLHKPDVVAPVAPVMADYTATDSLVRFSFMASSSEDVAMHRIYRRTGEGGAWEPLAEPAGLKGRVEWKDRSVYGPQYYAYAVQAVDSAGNASERTPPLLVRVNAPAKQQVVSNVVAVLVEEGIVQVRWTAAQEGLKHFVIYRSSNGGAPRTVGHAGPDERVFTDIRPDGKGAKTYLVKAVFDDGKATAPVAAVRTLDIR